MLKFILSDIQIRLSGLFYCRWHISPTGGQVIPIGTSSAAYQGTIQLIPTERLPVP